MKYLVVLIGLPLLVVVVLFPSSSLANLLLSAASLLLPMFLIVYGYIKGSKFIIFLGIIVLLVMLYLTYDSQIKPTKKK